MRLFNTTTIYLNKTSITLPSLIEKNLYGFLNNLQDQKEFLQFLSPTKKIQLIQLNSVQKSKSFKKSQRIIPLLIKKKVIKTYLYKLKKNLQSKNKINKVIYFLLQKAKKSPDPEASVLIKIANFLEEQGFLITKVAIKKGWRKKFIKNNSANFTHYLIIIILLISLPTHLILKTIQNNLTANYQTQLKTYETFREVKLSSANNLNQNFLFITNEINSLAIIVLNLKIQEANFFLKGFTAATNIQLLKNKIKNLKKIYPNISLNIKPINNNIIEFLVATL